MFGNIVTPSMNAAQVFAFIAIIVFVVAAIVSVLARDLYAVLISAGLVVLSAAVLFSPGV